MATITIGGQYKAGMFGDGSDGSVTFDGTTTVLGLVPSASAYTLTRDIRCTSITVNSGVTIKTANFRIFCTGTLTNAGTIDNSGASAAGQAGAANAASASFTGGRGGGNGGTGVSGAGANGTNANFGGTAGNGGAGTSGAAGNGGTSSQTYTVAQNNIWGTPFALLTGTCNYANATLGMIPGAGGGGGGSDASSNAGGGGGAGGGIVALFCALIVNTGTISANGGNGFTATAGNAGGGGGGNGGVVAAYTTAAWTQSGTVSVAAGALGNGHGTGSNGQNGSAGLSFNVVMA